MNRAVIISNGTVDDYTFFKSKISHDDFIICADGAIRHLLKIGIMPDLWIGDFDSCKFDQLCIDYPSLKQVQIKKLNPCKDETDTHICAIEAINKGYNDILILGGIGNRVDHMLGSVSLLEWLYENNVNAYIENEKNIITVVGNKTIIKKERDYISLIALDKEVFIKSFTGVKYPLDNFILKRGLTIGISNEILLNKANIDISYGRVLIIQSDD